MDPRKRPEYHHTQNIEPQIKKKVFYENNLQTVNEI